MSGAAPVDQPAKSAPWRAAEAHLAAVLPGYAPRPGQHQMMAAVADALATRSDLVVEAGTGTGKTLAYLLPVLAAGKRVVIATATKQLQGQLLAHDLPTALAATGARAEAVALKGRSNYLCHARFERTLQRRVGLGGVLSPALQAVQLVLHHSDIGEVAEVHGVDEQHPIWPEVTSTADNCLGTGCPMWELCFVQRARKRALRAQVVVVNHHVLLADLTLRERFDGGGLLPSADVVVIDEAHALPDVATSFFGHSLSSARVERLRRDVADLLRVEEAEASAAASAGGPGVGETDAVHGALRRFGVASAALFAELRDEVAPAGGQGGGANRADRAAPHLDDQALIRLQAARAQLHSASEALWTSLHQLHSVAGPAGQRALENLATLQTDLDLLLAPEEHDGLVRWVEARPRTTAVLARPAAVGPAMQRTLLAAPAVRIFTSATLAVEADFSAFYHRMGLDDAVVNLRLPGGFDYATQALLYLPTALPNPFAPGRGRALAGEIKRLVQASGGGAFALFSSYRAMREAHRQLGPRLHQELGMTVLLQGEESRAALLDRFAARQPAVLFATMGFWQGVDLPGDVLRLVMLDKIPFPPPNDPLFAARAALLKAEGGNAFAELSLPAAAQSLRQGFGRLIRSTSDRGVVAILDPRISTAGYGKRLLRALPDARRTAFFTDVQDFFAAG